jgi:hypothetical protein
MVITLDLNLDQLNNFKVLLDILYDSYIDKGGAEKNQVFHNLLDLINVEVDREIGEKKPKQ